MVNLTDFIQSLANGSYPNFYLNLVSKPTAAD